MQCCVFAAISRDLVSTRSSCGQLALMHEQALCDMFIFKLVYQLKWYNFFSKIFIKLFLGS